MKMPKTNHGDRGEFVAMGGLKPEYFQSFDHFKTVFLQPLIEVRMEATINKFD